MKNFNNEYEKYFKKTSKGSSLRFLLGLVVAGVIFYALYNAKTKEQIIITYGTLFVLGSVFYLYITFSNVFSMVKKMYRETDEEDED